MTVTYFESDGVETFDAVPGEDEPSPPLCGIGPAPDSRTTHVIAGNGPMHTWTCPPCMREATARSFYRATHNPHRPGTKVAAAWDRDRARVDWAMDMRGETYWSA